MINTVEIFYSFESPYSYLAIDQLARLEEEYDARVLWHPYSARAAGQGYQTTPFSGPSASSYAGYVREDIVRLAKKLDLPLVLRQDWPEQQFDPERSVRGALVAQDEGVLYEYNIKMFHRWWGEAQDPNDPTFLAELCDDLDIDSHKFTSRINTSDVRERVRGIFKRGQKLGIFDVPMIMIGEERFFGPDRISFVHDRLTELGLKKSRQM